MKRLLLVLFILLCPEWLAAQSPAIMTVILDRLPVSVATTAWNPSDKGSGVTLSGSNLVATFTEVAGTHEAVRSVASHSSGKFYAEFTVTTVVGNSQIGVGDSGFDITGSPGYLGGSA